MDVRETHLERALWDALTTFERELRLDRDARLIDAAEARRIDASERAETARVVCELHDLLRPHGVR